MANTKVTSDVIADGAITSAKLSGITTDNISEGTALYYTDSKVSTYLTNNSYITSSDITDLDVAYTVSVIGTSTTGVKDVAYVLTANLTLTLPATPSVGDKIKISNQSGTTTPIVARNGENIQGIAEDLVLDVDGFGIELIYSGATKGWVII